MLKKNIFLLLFMGMSLSYSCQSNNPDTKKETEQVKTSFPNWTPPPPGTEIASLKERIKEDQLNKFYFQVTVMSIDSSKEGVYEVLITYAFSKNKTRIRLPKWTNDNYPRPLLQKEGSPYHFLIGFDVGDSLFRPLYQIRVVDKSVRIKQTHEYTIYQKAGGSI